MSDTASNVSSSSSALSRVRRRNADSGAGAVGPASSRSGSAAGMLKMYSEDIHGLKVDPIVVLVLSLIFTGSVFALHIWGKYTRGV